MYDVNPVPYGDELSLNVSEDDNRIAIELALSTAVKYNISTEEAAQIVQEITDTPYLQIKNPVSKCKHSETGLLFLLYKHCVLYLLFISNCCLCCCKSCDRHTEWGT